MYYWRWYFIVIAVQKGLDKIKADLEERGYVVVNAESCSCPIDALVYEGCSFQISHITGDNIPSINSAERCSYGVLLINSTGKSIDDLEYIINRRCYSPLF